MLVKFNPETHTLTPEERKHPNDYPSIKRRVELLRYFRRCLRRNEVPFTKEFVQEKGITVEEESWLRRHVAHAIMERLHQLGKACKGASWIQEGIDEDDLGEFKHRVN